jgi:hypothetical protein
MPTINAAQLSTLLEPIPTGLEYGACFMQQLTAQAQQKAVAAVYVEGYTEDADNTLATLDPPIFYGLSHGNPCMFNNYLQARWSGAVYIPGEGECEGGTRQPSLGTVEFRCLYDRNLDKMKGRHVHLLSCLTGIALGPALIRAGAKSYIGYSQVFIFGVCPCTAPWPEPCSPPSDNADFYSMIDSDIEGMRKILLENATVGEAVNAMKAKFQYYIDKYERGEWKDRPIAYDASLTLRWDLQYLTALGDMNWRPLTMTTTAPKTMILGMPAIAYIGAIAIATQKY